MTLNRPDMLQSISPYAPNFILGDLETSTSMSAVQPDRLR